MREVIRFHFFDYDVLYVLSDTARNMRTREVIPMILLRRLKLTKEGSR